MSENIGSLSDLTSEVLHRLYITEGRSTYEIAELYGCTDATIRTRLKSAGISARSRSQARVLAIKRGKLPKFAEIDFDTRFFQEWSAPMAWVLGLLYTDGYFRDTPTRKVIRLALNDLETLEKVSTALKYTGTIKERRQSYDKTNIIFVLELSREELFNDLRRIGLKPNKSLDMKFPDVPAQFIRHFIRGCWDGDGGFTFNEQTGVGGAHYTCGSLAFITRLAEELGKVGIRAIKLDGLITIYKRKNANAYDLRISNKDNLQRLFDYLYIGVDEQHYMTRKHRLLSQKLAYNECHPRTPRT